MSIMIVRALTVALVAVALNGCAADTSQETEDSNLTSGITATKAIAAPKTDSELLRLLQSDAEGALPINADIGAWEYVAGPTSPPLKAGSTVYFTDKSPAPGSIPYQKLLEVEGACGSSACERHTYTVFTNRSVDGGFGLLIDGKEYRFAGLKPETFGPGPIAQTLMFITPEERSAFSLVRYRKGI